MDELRQNFTIVIVTHSMQQAARVSQRAAFFHLGNLVRPATQTGYSQTRGNNGPKPAHRPVRLTEGV